MKKICLYFEIHQIVHLKRYRFFDIGRDHYYYDDYENERSINDIAERSYVPALQTLIQMCKDYPEFRVAFSLSGCGLEQLEFHAPQVVDLLQEINSTGQVEFLCEPYSHGLASLANEESFAAEVKRMSDRIKELFGKRPKVFRNSSLIYNDEIGAQVASMGFKGILTEGAKQVLGWKSPHYIYHCATDPRLKLLLRDINLSEDITERFTSNPIMADQWLDWIASTPEGENFINEERDTSCWLGNVMQREAFNKLYSVADRVRVCGDRRIQMDWDSLQASNNFRFMTTKPGYQYRGIYDSPYDAFTNYMNILGDFISRVNNLYGGADNEEIDGLIPMIKNQGDELAAKDKEIERLRKKLEKYNPTELEEKKPEPKAAPAKKAPAAKKAVAPKKEPVKKAAPKAKAVKKEEKAPAKAAAPKKATPKKK